MVLLKNQSPFLFLLKSSGVDEPFLLSVMKKLSGFWVKLWLMMTNWSDCGVTGNRKEAVLK